MLSGIYLTIMIFYEVVLYLSIKAFNYFKV